MDGYQKIRGRVMAGFERLPSDHEPNQLLRSAVARGTLRTHYWVWGGEHSYELQRCSGWKSLLIILELNVHLSLCLSLSFFQKHWFWTLIWHHPNLRKSETAVTLLLSPPHAIKLTSIAFMWRARRTLVTTIFPRTQCICVIKGSWSS